MSRRRTPRALGEAAAIVGLVFACATALGGLGGAAIASVYPVADVQGGGGPSDVIWLNEALAADQRAIAGYVASGPLLSGDAQKADGWFLGQELRHAGVLRSLIAGLGGTPHDPDPSYPFGHPRTTGQVIALLRSLERGQIAATAAAIGGLHEGWMRARLAAMLADDAQHLAVLGIFAGQPRSGGAFPVSFPARVNPRDDARFSDLLRAETLVAAVIGWAEQSGRLGTQADELAAFMGGHEDAQLNVLARMLRGAARRGSSSGTSGGLTLGEVLRASSVPISQSELQHGRGWVHLLAAVEWQLEGLLYYVTIPRLTARDALLATSIMASAAEHAALLAELPGPGSTPTAVPAALVRGKRLRDQPPW